MIDYFIWEVNLIALGARDIVCGYYQIYMLYFKFCILLLNRNEELNVCNSY